MQSYAGLHIGNLDSSITTDLIFTFFSRYNIINIHHPYDHLKKQHKPFAFVYFKNQESAKKALEECKYEKILNKPIRLAPILNLKQIDKNANCFAKNVDPSVTPKEFDEYFKQFGDIINSTLRTDQNGESLGYGYIQFSNTQQAQKCIAEANGQQFKDSVITVEIFKTRPLRNNTAQKNNVYFKGMKPLMDDDKAEEIIKQKFSEFGNITSMITKQSEPHGAHWGFVCFETHEGAQQAIDNLHEQDIFNIGEKFYCGYAMTKLERQRSSNDKNKVNDTRIYIRSLKLEVTAESLKQAFQIFGNPISASVRECKLKQEGEQLKFGFVEMSSKEEAQETLKNGVIHPDILALSTVNPAYLKLAQSKEVRTNYLRLLKQKRGQKQFNTFFNNNGYSNRQLPQMINPMMLMMQQYFQQFFKQMQYMSRNNYNNYNNYNRGGNNYNQRRGGYNKRQYNQGYHKNYRRQNNQQQRNYNNNGYQNQQRMRGQQNQQQRSQQHQQQVQKPNQQQPVQQPLQQKGQQPPQNTQPPKQQPFNMGNQQPINQVTSPSIPTQIVNPAQQTKPVLQPPPVQLLEQRMGEFQNLNPSQQRNILGEMFFPVVRNISPNYAPKITGMLIDLDVSSIDDILNLLKNEDLLREKVQSAEQQLLQSQEQQQQQQQQNTQ